MIKVSMMYSLSKICHSGQGAFVQAHFTPSLKPARQA
jgi:hypothetical protein